jgi:hypothetical protein
VVGGPVGAAVGAGVGGIVGAGVADDHHHDRVIVQEQRPAVTDRTCVRDSFGNEKCTVIRR